MAASAASAEGAPRAPSSRIYVPGIALGPVARHMAVARGSQILLLGGAVSAQDTFPVTLIDLEREICIRPQCLGPAPPPQLVYATSSLVGDRIYIIGGKPSPTSDTIAVFSLDVSGADTFVWRAIPAAAGPSSCQPSPRYKHSASVVRDREIWIVGGKDFATFNNTIYSDVFKFDTVTRVWQRIQITNFPLRSIFNHTAVTIKDRIWVFGGHNGRESTDVLCSIRVEPPYQATLEPVPHGRAPERRACHAAISVGCKMYILGGRNGQKGDLGNMHELDTVSRTWRSANLSADDQRLLKRSSHTASLIGKTVWLVGGQSDVGSPSEAIVGVRIPITDELASSGPSALFPRDTMRQLVYAFNRNSREALEAIGNLQGLASGLVPAAEVVAKFIRTAENLDKNAIGEFLGEGDEFNIAVLRAFVHMLDFSDIGFDVALRFFLSFFRPPGEAQKIERLMDAFGEKYFHDNKSTIFHSPVSVSTLGYSMMMLNTDRHNPAVKQKMKHEAFIRNNRGMNGGQDFPREFLKALYYSIKSCPLQMGPDPRGLQSASSVQSESKSALSKFFFGPRRSTSPSRIPVGEAALHGHVSARQSLRISSLSSATLPSVSSQRSMESHADAPLASAASGSEEEGRRSGALSPVSVDGGGDVPALPTSQPHGGEDYNPFAESTGSQGASAVLHIADTQEERLQDSTAAVAPPDADSTSEDHPALSPVSPQQVPSEAEPPPPHADSTSTVSMLETDCFSLMRSSSAPPCIHLETSANISTELLISTPNAHSAPRNAEHVANAMQELSQPPSQSPPPEEHSSLQPGDFSSSQPEEHSLPLPGEHLLQQPQSQEPDSPDSSRSGTPDRDHLHHPLEVERLGRLESLGPEDDGIPRSVSFMSDDLAVSFRTDPSHAGVGHLRDGSTRSIVSIMSASSAPPVSATRDADFNSTTAFSVIAQKLLATSTGVLNASSLFNDNRLRESALEAADGIERILSEPQEGGTLTDKLVAISALESHASTLQHTANLQPKSCENMETAIQNYKRWRAEVATELLPAVEKAAAAVSELVSALQRVSFGQEEVSRLAFCAEAEVARRRASPSFFQGH